MGIDSVEAVFRRSDPPLWIVTAGTDVERAGLVATCVVQASIVDSIPRVLVGVGKSHDTWTMIEASLALGLHWIGPDRVDWVERFGASSSREADKFAGLRVETDPTGVPILLDAPARFVCRVEAKWDAGDRTFYLGAVTDAVCDAPAELVPLSMGRAAPMLPLATLQKLAASRSTDAIRDADAVRRWRATSDQCLLPEDLR